jgi:hypothetical protein
VCSINSTSALPPFISLHIPPATLPSQAKCSNYRPIQLIPMSHKDIRLPTPQPHAYRRSAKHLHGTLVPQLFKASNCFPSCTPNRASVRSSSNDRLSPAAPDCWACRRLRLLAQLGMVADPSRWRARCEYACKGLLFPISASSCVDSGDYAAMLGLEKWSAVRERRHLSRSNVVFIRGKYCFEWVSRGWPRLDRIGSMIVWGWLVCGMGPSRALRHV